MTLRRRDVRRVVEELEARGTELDLRVIRIIDELDRGWIGCGQALRRLASAVTSRDTAGLLRLQESLREETE